MRSASRGTRVASAGPMRSMRLPRMTTVLLLAIAAAPSRSGWMTVAPTIATTLSAAMTRSAASARTVVRPTARTSVIALDLQVLVLEARPEPLADPRSQLAPPASAERHAVVEERRHDGDRLAPERARIEAVQSAQLVQAEVPVVERDHQLPQRRHRLGEHGVHLLRHRIEHVLRHARVLALDVLRKLLHEKPRHLLANRHRAGGLEQPLDLGALLWRDLLRERTARAKEQAKQ